MRRRLLAKRRGPVRRRVLGCGVVLGAVLLVGWSVTAGPGSVLLPTPAGVVASLAANLGDPAYWGYVWTTLAEAFGGALLGVVVALPLAVVIHRSRWAAAAVNPLAVVQPGIGTMTVPSRPAAAARSALPSFTRFWFSGVFAAAPAGTVISAASTIAIVVPHSARPCKARN